MRSSPGTSKHRVLKPGVLKPRVLETRDPEPLSVLTIGHSVRTWEEFRDLLRVHDVRRVIDVRTIPRSRRNPQFSRETLSRSLHSSRIGYVHLPALGGLRRARPFSVNTGWRNASFRGYADYMQTPDFDSGLRRLIELAAEKRSAVMCAEAVPWRCHRSLVADALVVRGVPVVEILSESTYRMHELTPFAQVEGARITYPSEQATLL